MDGRAAISDNIEALKRILAGIVAMAGLARLSSPRAAEDGSTRQGEAEPPAEPGEGSGRFTLPRHLRLAILRLLRPAESAARRLIIAAARGLVVTLPLVRESKPKPVDPSPFLRRFGIAVVLSPEDIARAEAARRAASLRAARPRRLTLPLFDQPRRLAPWQRCYVPAHAAPRILSPGLATPHVLPSPPSPDDAIDATRLGLRLAALAEALDNLPAEIRRFARWQARRNRVAPGRSRRVSPLRPGRPPGGRMSRFDPAASRRSNIRDIDEVLAHSHVLALYALQYPDTS